ncbi:alpha/beta fold hydrolase [Saccharibacter sp. 17.LH.SD]|uniref:alpha/beta fold hydrolase n=1 Tax=Saccharibacter sp. 17.LH.SD TaxID=2689393 RepID=UPI00136AB3F5|nr:alpha/beta fold hydrolase [Saccharibacter sp. 17.LH.SD]MXV45219.1 alpha/beta fold hydrolase [Saccharibacter sp. 17.LH.SD]
MQLASLIRNDSDNPHAPTVVLLHGVFGRARNLGLLQRTLSHHFNTIALDLRSHGHSPHEPLTYPEMARDVLETLDHLSIQSASLIGHSMGGKVAMMTSLLAPERVQRLIVADIAPAPMHHGQNTLAQALLRSLPLPALHNRKDIHDFLMPLTGNPAISDLLGQNITPGDPAHWTIGLTEIANSFATIEGWPEMPPNAQWSGEALFLRGEHSPYVQPHHRELIHHFFPHATIQTIPETGHWLHVEKPKEFAEAALSFLMHS